MVYCSKCGKKNEEDAEFCSKCGASLKGKPYEWERHCEEECPGGKHGAPLFWGIVLILIGLWVIFEFVLKRISGLPVWIYTFEFWWIFALLIGICIIFVGLRMIIRR
jgi:hypothetical protein